MVMSSDRAAGGQAESAPSPTRRYGIALTAVALSASAWFGLDLVFERPGLLLVFVPAVLVSSALGGLAPGLLATFLSLAIGAFDQSLTGGRPDFVGIGIFAIVSLGISYW